MISSKMLFMTEDDLVLNRLCHFFQLSIHLVMIKITTAFSWILIVSLVTGKYLLMETEGRDNLSGARGEAEELEEGASWNDYFGMFSICKIYPPACSLHPHIPSL